MTDGRATAPAELADRLAEWALTFDALPADRELANRSLIDTLAVAAAARDHPQMPVVRLLGPAGRVAALSHLADYDDLHIPTTTHISAVCVAAAIATGGGAEAYLAGAGVMARLGGALGWPHYDAGWHATCTAGAPGAAVTASLALGLDAAATRIAIALALPAAGGVNRAFGTSAKSLQVGFAADAGVRAARLAAAGATADGAALGQWLALVGGRDSEWPEIPAIPGGLAVKAYPCCYALQRPIAAIIHALDGDRPSAAEVEAVTVRTPLVTVRPLIHDRPVTGLEGKFSLQYGIASAILDGTPGLTSFTDTAVRRPEAQRLLDRVQLQATEGGEDLLAGATEVEVRMTGGRRYAGGLTIPPGAPGHPLDDAELARKVCDCAGTRDSGEILAADWEHAATLVDQWFER